MADASAAMMPLISSLVVVALAEIDDKTQLIALTLGLRYRRFRELSIP
jgi:putative Ca2+/H+ antiporter (TMEM165/GDT1 family)